MEADIKGDGWPASPFFSFVCARKSARTPPPKKGAAIDDRSVAPPLNFNLHMIDDLGRGEREVGCFDN